MINTNIKSISFSEEEYSFYSKHLIINNIGLNGQKRLKEAKILFIGAGGLACPAMLYLAVLGIGYIGIVDDDYIDRSNLNRQILYNSKDLNQLKVVCAKKQLNNINKYCKIILHSYKLNKNNAFNIIQYYDIVLDTTDNFRTRYLIDTLCYKLNKTHIYGAIQQFESQISVFNYKNSMNYSSIYPEILNLKDNTCNEYGTLGLITGYTGILQATEAMKIILGIGKITYNELLISNLLKKSISTIKTKKNLFFYIKKCKTFYNYENYISKTKFFYFKKHLSNNIVLIDIRQRYEFIENNLSYSINIPLNKFKNKKTINFIENKSQYKTIFIYCNKMYRSIIVSNILKNKKIQHYLLK